MEGDDKNSSSLGRENIHVVWKEHPCNFHLCDISRGLVQEEEGREEGRLVVGGIWLAQSIVSCTELKVFFNKFRNHLKLIGGVAQMVERSLSMREVRGSMPLSSIFHFIFLNFHLFLST